MKQLKLLKYLQNFIDYTWANITWCLFFPMVFISIPFTNILTATFCVNRVLWVLGFTTLEK